MTLTVVGEDAAPGQPGARIYVGPCQAARRAGVDAATLEPEACLIKTAGDALFVVGDDGPGDALSTGTRAGTLWGVYELLEQVLGVRWLWPGELGVVVPRTANVAMPAADRRIKPWLLQRQLRSGLNLRGDQSRGFSKEGYRRYSHAQRVFLRRHRIGRCVRLRYGHAFESWWKRYGAEHPDWFQLLPNGKRGPTSTHARFSMCVSSPGSTRRLSASGWRAGRSSPTRS